jgi:hypothetical protein
MAGVAKYSLEIKPSAAKELDVLDNALFTRIDRESLALAENHALDARSSEGTKINDAPRRNAVQHKQQGQFTT